MFDSKASIVEKYDPITVDCVQERRIMDGREMSSDQGNKAAVVVNNYLYVVSSSKVEKFNNLSLSWEKVGKGTLLVSVTNDRSAFSAMNFMNETIEYRKGRSYWTSTRILTCNL
jgi:hypothetical protein